MKFRNIALITTALTALGSVAMADTNTTYLSQNGTSNDALVVQAGDNNTAGTTSANSMLQDGDDNNLDVSQSGDNNRAGSGNEFIQTGKSNIADLDQSGDNNRANRLRQTATATTTAASTNIANMTQSSNNNLIDRVDQRFSGTGTEAVNTLDILQATGDGNVVSYAWQLGLGNNTDIQQTGENNAVSTFQYGTGPTGYSNGTFNDISVVMSGDNNGRGSLTGDYSGAETAFSAGAGGAPWSVGLRSATVTQRGNFNEASLDIMGNDNDFGVHQRGDSNDSLGIVITGDLNSFSSDQVGDLNVISLSTVTGDMNSIGFVQEGNNNLASADVIGDMNRARLMQTGNDNDTSLWVDGNSSTAALDVTGDSNVLRAQQRWGDSNTMTVNLYGSFNNNSGSFFTDDALSARNDANAVTGLTFGRGRLWQHGTGNELTLDVGALGAGSDSNLFATLQQGDNNVIVGSISGGNNNQAVVAQLGSFNTTNFSQKIGRAHV